MSFFPFIEGIFYLSLGIIIVLIFLIVFHFKQRIETLEKKGFLLTEIYNNHAKELNIMKSYIYSPPSLQQKQNIVFSTIPNGEPEFNSYKKIIVMDKIHEEPSYDGENEDEDDDEDEDDEEEVNEGYEKKESEYLPIESIDLEFESLPEEKESIQVLKMEPEPELEPEQVTEPSTTISYSKLNLNELKTLVISKGLSTNPNKMKRAELLKLLEEETI